MGDWKLGTVGDLVTLQRGIDLPSEQRISGNTPIMGSFGITGWHNNSACKGPGVTVGRSGASVGVVNYIDRDFWPLNTCLYVKDFKKNDPSFIYYLLKNMDLSRLNSGSAQPSLNRNFVHPVPVTFPDRTEQEAIGSILTALDKKIELNRQMNEMLEAMARAIFKDWFVDFGPTRAKMAGIKPYLAPEIWNLFPDRLDDESTPNGWNVPKFEELVQAKQGKYLAKEEMTEVGSPDFPYPAWGGNGILGYSRKFDYDIPINLITCRGSNCGLIRLTESKASVSNNAFACRPRFGSTYFLHIYFLLESFSDCISGSAQPQITYTALRSKRMRFAVEQKMVERFSLLVEPLFQKILANKNEMENLAQIRDLLLPKLMSGEIRVRDAKSTPEAVTAMAS